MITNISCVILDMNNKIVSPGLVLREQPCERPQQPAYDFNRNGRVGNRDRLWRKKERELTLFRNKTV